MLPLNSHDLKSYLIRLNIPAEIVQCPEPTPTVEDAARVMGVQPNQIVKTILFLISGQPVVVIACGTGNIDRRPLADRFGVGKKQVKLAGAEAVEQLTGYPAGTVPPFGHKQQFITILDPQVLSHHLVYAGGGEENALVAVDPRDIARVTRADMLRVLTYE